MIGLWTKKLHYFINVVKIIGRVRFKSSQYRITFFSTITVKFRRYYPRNAYMMFHINLQKSRSLFLVEVSNLPQQFNDNHKISGISGGQFHLNDVGQVSSPICASEVILMFLYLIGYLLCNSGAITFRNVYKILTSMPKTQ